MADRLSAKGIGTRDVVLGGAGAALAERPSPKHDGFATLVPDQTHAAAYVAGASVLLIHDRPAIRNCASCRRLKPEWLTTGATIDRRRR